MAFTYNTATRYLLTTRLQNLIRYSFTTTGIVGNIQSSSRWNSGGHRLVLKPLKPLFKTEDTLMGSRYELEPRATEQ